jgi:hypothetical protein
MALDPGQDVCEIDLWIVAVEFGSLCRPTNYAELAGLCQRFS